MDLFMGERIDIQSQIDILTLFPVKSKCERSIIRAKLSVSDTTSLKRIFEYGFIYILHCLPFDNTQACHNGIMIVHFKHMCHQMIQRL